jgi:hypothetical protein
VFELMPQNNEQWTEKILYNFGDTSDDGNSPYTGVLFDASGNLYGTTIQGGVYNYGRFLS